MSKIHTIFVLAVLSTASGCSARLSPSCAPPALTVAAVGENAVRGPLWPLAQCACRADLDRFGNHSQFWVNPSTDSLLVAKFHSQLRQVSIPQDQCVDGHPVEGRPIALTLVNQYLWNLSRFATLTVSDLNAHPSFKFSTSPEGDLQAAWRRSLPSGSPTDRLSLVPADVMDPEIRAAFEAEKRFWLTEVGQVSTGLPPAPATPSQ